MLTTAQTNDQSAQTGSEKEERCDRYSRSALYAHSDMSSREYLALRSASDTAQDCGGVDTSGAACDAPQA